MAKDPVCGMTVDEKKAAATMTHEGKTYYFCAGACRDKFAKNAKQYVGKS
jgi:YHS domain-containing protein